MRTILQNTRNVDHVRFNLTLIRHAETHANSEGIIQGLLDTELSDIGYLQSQVLGRHLQFHRFSHIFSSDLKRASETARQILSLNIVSSCNIRYESLLRERMYGIAQGQTRQWLRELAKENGVPYKNFTPLGAETPDQVRERAITFFRKLCQELLQKFGTNLSSKSDESTLLTKQNNSQPISRCVSIEDLKSYEELSNHSHRKRSLSTGNDEHLLATKLTRLTSSRLSIDSAFDLSSVSSDQQSLSSSLSISSRNNSFEKNRNLFKNLSRSPYANHFSSLDVLIVSHGAVIRELIKYFACDLQTDVGPHLDTIQDIAPNTAITRFEVTYSKNEDSNPTASLQLVDYHNKTHLVNANHEECNLDVVNKCSF